jgi:hypothetical protein
MKTFGLILARKGFLDGVVKLDRAMQAVSKTRYDSEDDQKLMRMHREVTKIKVGVNIRCMVSCVYRRGNGEEW